MADISNFERHNVMEFQGGIRARKALYSHLTPSSGCVFIAGFSTEMANTGDVVHYILERNSTTSVGTLYCKDENFTTISSISYGPVPTSVVLTHAIIARQILINSPQLPFAVYGLVGGGMIVANSVASVNPNTTAIPIPAGVVCTFAERVALAQGANVYFSDGGFEPRTFVAENVVALPSTIYDMYSGPGGALIMATADGVYALTADAAGQGQIVYGMLSRISPYQCRNYRNTCYSQGRLLGLTQTGITELTETLSSIPLVTYAGKRYLTENVGPGTTGDYRSGKVYATNDSGALVTLNEAVCAVEIQQSLQATWHTSGAALIVVGVLQNSDGMDYWLTPQFLLESWGNQEFDDGDFKAILAGSFKVPPQDSTLIRHITTEADNVGGSQLMYTGGQAKTATTPAAARQANIIGTSTWSASNDMASAELRSRRHHVVLRTDEVTLEVGVSNALSRIGDVDIDTSRNVSPRRPTN